MNHLLELEERGRGSEKYTAIHSWASQLDALQNTIANKVLPLTHPDLGTSSLYDPYETVV